MNNPVDLTNAELVPRGGYESVIQRIQEKGQCPFCREHLLEHHTKPLIEDGVRWIVTENAWPYEGTKHQFLLISRRHVEHIADLKLQEQADFFGAINRLTHQYRLEGFTVLWRSGATTATGASVSHLHAHMIVGHPRTDDAAPITGLVGFGPSTS
jgi:ATP adenylyltransferase